MSPFGLRPAARRDLMVLRSNTRIRPGGARHEAVLYLVPEPGASAVLRIQQNTSWSWPNASKRMAIQLGDNNAEVRDPGG